MKLLSYISIVLGVAFGLHGVVTGDLTFQPFMYFFFSIASLTLAYKYYKKGEKRNAISFTIPFLVSVTVLIVLFTRIT